MASYDEFRILDLRVATIRSAERVEGSEKLLKLHVDLGSELGDAPTDSTSSPPANSGHERQIIAGIGTRYQPGDLVGRQIIIVANLEPRALMGLESRGMLLAADGGDGPSLLAPDRPVPPGSTVR